MNQKTLRLEQFFYKTVVQDLQIITYNHAHATKLTPPPPKASVYSIFSTPIAALATRPLESATTQIDSLFIKPPKKIWDRPVKNIMFGKMNQTLPLTKKPDPIYTPTHQGLPSLKKIKLKIYTEAAIASKQVLLAAIMSLTQVSAIRAYPLFAERGDSAKKIREGMCIGCEVEITGTQMYAFMDKLIYTVLPRIREWQGLNPVRPDGDTGLVLDLDKSSMGFFPDIEPFFDMYPRLFDTSITFYTSGKNELEDALVLSSMGFPIRKDPIVKEVVDESIVVFDPNDPYAAFKKIEKKEKIPIVGTPIRKKMK